MSDKWLNDDELKALGINMDEDSDSKEQSETENILGDLLSDDSDSTGESQADENLIKELQESDNDGSKGKDEEEYYEEVYKQETEVQGVSFEEFSDESTKIDGKNFDMKLLYDIPLEVKVLFGRVKKTIGEILEMEEGSVIELEKLAGEPVDIMVGDEIIAKGEVVIIEDNFGVYITEVISPIERVRTVGNKLKRIKQES